MKRTTLTRSLSLVLMILLLAGTLLFAGCGQSTATSGTTSGITGASTTKATTPTTKEEKVQFSYWSYWCANAVDGNYCEKLIEDALNVDIKAKNISQSENDKVNLMLSSGEMPDCGWFGKSIDFMHYTNDLTRNITKTLVSQYVPGMTELFSKNPILESLVTSKENANEYYGLPTYQAYSAGRQYFYADFYRKDWLDKLKIAYPGAVKEVTKGVFMCDTGYTLDQHKAILEAFTQNDPDGNGKKDTVGTIGAGNGGLVTWTLLGAYGLCDSFSVNDNGKAVYYYSTDRYKKILAYAASLYKAGLVDKEIFTLNSQQFWEKAQKSYGGHFNVSANWLGSWASNRPPLNILNNVAGSSILITPGMVGPDGQMGSRQWAALPVWNTDFYFFVNKKVTDEKKLAKILQFVQYANFGDKKMDLIFGEKNVDYTLDSSNMPVRNAAFTEQNAKGIQAYSLVIQDEKTLSWMNDALFRSTFDYTVGSGKWIKYLISPYKYDLKNTTNLVKVTADYASSVNTIVNEFTVGVISGETNLDGEWANYLAKLNKAGYDKICAELDKAPLYKDVMAGK